MRTTIYAFMLFAASLLLSACGDAAQKGERAAHDLIAAWGDTTAMRQVVDRLEQERAALTWPWQRTALDRAFSRPLLESGRDSLVQAAYIVTLSPDEFAEVKVGAMVDAFLRGESLKPLGESYEYLNIIHWLGHTLGREQVIETFDRRIDSAANALPLADQMKLYSLSCTPAVLGAALADDANRPDADKADIARRIELLRELYSADDFAAFEQSYRQALKTEP